MAVTGSITTRFVDEKGVDLGKTLIEKDYLISVYPNIVNQLDTPMLMMWGRNSEAQLGDNTINPKSSPVQTIAYGANWKQVATGQYHTMAIKTDGTLWGWGAGGSGQIGDNLGVGSGSRSSPVQTTAFGTNWKQVNSGYLYTTATKTDGTLWAWGSNSSGQLGDNTVTNRSSPVQTVTFATNWKQVSAGNYSIAAIKEDGTLWNWGKNSYGQLGDNTTANKSSPIQTIAFGTNWMQVSAGYASAAIKADGTLWTWGYNTYGQLGDNTTANKSSPIQTIAFGTNWKKAACGKFHIAAIKTDGTLWCFGRNNFGQLGDNTTANKSSPIQTIAFGTNWKSVACGQICTIATKTDGTLWAWGYNSSGQLGDNTITSRSSPVQTILYGQNWKSVSNVGEHTAAIKDGDI